MTTTRPSALLADVRTAAAVVADQVDLAWPDPTSLDDVALLDILGDVAAAMRHLDHAHGVLMAYRDDLYYAARYRRPRIKTQTLAAASGMTEGSIGVAVHRAEAARRR